MLTHSTAGALLVVGLGLVGQAAAKMQYTYVGCFKDQATPRDMDYWVAISDLSLTQQKCAELCDGYLYFGVQYNGQCFCGNSYGVHGQVDESKCKAKCPGDRTQICGGTYHSNIYKIVYPEGTFKPAVLPESLGCWTDGKTTSAETMPWTKATITHVSPQACMAICVDFPYYGLKLGRECQCGIRYDKYEQTTATKCNKQCGAERRYFCGGPDRATISVYENTAYIPPATYKHRGCLYNKGVVPKTVVRKTEHRLYDMSSAFCANVCRRSDWFMLHYGKHCYCGAGELTGSIVSGTSCNTACTGNKTETCGSNIAMDVYMYAPECTPEKSTVADSVDACVDVCSGTPGCRQVGFSPSRKICVPMAEECEAAFDDLKKVEVAETHKPSKTFTEYKNMSGFQCDLANALDGFSDLDAASFAECQAKALGAHSVRYVTWFADTRKCSAFETCNLVPSTGTTHVAGVTGADVPPIPPVTVPPPTVSLGTTIHLVDKAGQPLANIIVGIFNKDGELVDFGQTDENGLLTFVLPAGEYIVYPQPPTGREPTEGDGAFVIEVEGGASEEIRIVSSIPQAPKPTIAPPVWPSASVAPTASASEPAQPKPGFITGSIYSDTNGNNKNDAGEGIANVKVSVLDSENKAYGSEIETDANGRYVFRDLPTGTYTVVIGDVPNTQLPPGAERTKTINVVPNSTNVFDFRILGQGATGILKVKVFLDANANEEYDAEEEVLEGAKVSLFTPEGESVFEEVVDKNGDLVMRDVPFGEYIISLDLSKHDFLGASEVEGYIDVAAQSLTLYFALQVS